MIKGKSNREAIETVFRDNLFENNRRTDRIFAVLMPVQWLFAIGVALVYTPLTWNGTESSVHQHLYAALFFGGPITLFPAYLVWKKPGTALTRHTIAASQLLMSGLLIHLTGGRTSTHFHIFGSLAFLAFYRDWRVLITASAVTAADHLFRGVWYPLSIFGATSANIWLIVEHAAYVVFEDIFLVLGCRQAIREMRLAAARQIEAEAAGAELEREKTAVEKSAREAEMQQLYLTENAARMLIEMEKFAEGDLRVEIERGRDDEMGRLIEGFNRAVAKTGNLLARMIEAVNTTANSASEIRISTESLAESSSEQHEQARTAASTIKEMVELSNESTEVVRLAAEAVHQGGESAVKGKKIVDEAVGKMGQIAEFVKTSTNTVEKLGNSSQEIGKIVTVINDIARQTNLLALNAAVEAARAGEHGAGFAVVAGEVRQLAIRTTEATSQISEVILSIQKDTVEAIGAMRLGTKEVEQGIDLSNSTREALETIVQASDTMIRQVERVVTVNREQTESSVKVSANVQTISKIAARSAENVKAITDSIYRLNRMTEDLRGLTSQFKLKNDEANFAPRAAAKIAEARLR